MRRIQGLSSYLAFLAYWLAGIAIAMFLIGCGGANSGTMILVQRQLAALPCPPGVSAELWDTLTAELAGQLTKRASAEALSAGPPLDEFSVVDDLTASEPAAGNIRLRWSYKNTGDYDQNSETNISDLTPIGRHFNKTAASADWGTASVADGDLNSEVNISDVTPIGRCYLQTVTEYRVEYIPTGGAGSEFEPFGAAEFAAGEPDANGWLRFDATFGGAASGYYRVVPYYNAERGIEGTPVYFGANQPPTAVLRADPQAGRTPMVVSFDASESSDPEHSALTFSWDWEGDGVFDLESGSSAVQDHEYTEEGDYAPQLKVKDTKGLEATTRLLVSTHNWISYEIVPLGEVFSAALVNGKPVFAYDYRDRDLSSWPDVLSYARSTLDVPQSAEDWELMVVHPSYQIGEIWVNTVNMVPQVFELNGCPAIFYNIGGPVYGFFLARATVAEPSGPVDWVISKICDDSQGILSSEGAPFVVDGKPYVAFTYSDVPKIQLARSLVAEPSGPEDWQISEVSTYTDQETGYLDLSAGLVAGKLSIAYLDQANSDLRFATADSLAPTGPGDWHVTIVDSEWVTNVQLAEFEGKPLIASTGTVGSQAGVKLARALAAAPQSPADWVHSSPASFADTRHMSMAVSETSCGILVGTQGPADEHWQLSSLYPQPSETGSLSGPWVVEQLDNGHEDYYPDVPEILVSGDWLICLYIDVYKPHTLVDYPTYCSIANMPKRYSP